MKETAGEICCLFIFWIDIMAKAMHESKKPTSGKPRLRAKISGGVGGIRTFVDLALQKAANLIFFQ